MFLASYRNIAVAILNASMPTGPPSRNSLGPVFFGLACRHGASSPTNGNPARQADRAGLRADPRLLTQRGHQRFLGPPTNAGGGWRVPRVKSGVLPVPVDGRWRQRSPTGSNRTR